MNTSKPVAILVHEGYQDLEFWYPLLRLREEDRPVTVIAVETDKTYFSQLEYPVIADIGIAGAKGADYACVFVPGGQSAKIIAEEPRMQAFIRDAAKAGAFLASISEGTTAIKAAGAKGAREVTARGTNDLPEFCKALFAALAK
jgi:protease I